MKRKAVGEGPVPRGLAQLCCSLLGDFFPSLALNFLMCKSWHKSVTLNLLGAIDFLFFSCLVL